MQLSKTYKKKGFTQHHFSRNVAILKNSAGFTLIETLVAISVLLVAVAAPLSLASQSLSSSIRAKERLIATYLALEGAEFTRNIRDENVLSGNSWLNGLTGCRSDNYCMIDPSLSNPIVACGGTECDELWFNETAGVYAYDTGAGWTRTPYIRSMYVEVSGSEAEVVVTVSYPTGVRTKELTIRENLKDWQ